MLFKTLIISILSCSLLGFSITDDPAQSGKLLRTPEGMILIPSSANLAAKDAQALANIISAQNEEVGVLVIDGNIVSSNKSITMEDVQKTNLSFEGRLIEEGKQSMGAYAKIAGKTSAVCYRQLLNDRCVHDAVWQQTVVVEMANGPAIITQAEKILDKYGYVTLK